MDVVTRIAELRLRVRAARDAGQVIGAVPTMGAFHEGHRSLMRRARAECGFVVTTLFVNPTQFGPSEDLDRYPRAFEADQAVAEAEGVDLLFAPPVEEVYRPGAATWVMVERLTETLCGRSRPHHFRGVTTVVAKLLNMVLPDRAYFGEKDYQQLQVLRRMVEDLDFAVEIVPCAIVRDPDGLAMSSRNRFLSASEREAALSLSRGLAAARAQFDSGERWSDPLRATVLRELEAEPLVRPDYVELVDAHTLQPVGSVADPAVLAVAAWVGPARLIDNTQLAP